MIDAALAFLALPVLCASGYLLLLALFSRPSRPPTYGPARLFFDIVVPARDEEAGIGSTVESLLSLDYPRDLFRVLVVADNCSDRTAERAAAAGAQVLARNDSKLRAKGFALAHAFAHSLSEGRADAIVVVDADTLASPNLLRAFSARLEAGAGALQADYAVRNPNVSWRTRLMTIALATFHLLRSRARERLGVSVGLRGNGMCLSSTLLRRVPYDAFSLVEDVEYGIRLGEAGERVHYAEEAQVLGEMVSSGRAAASQRRRWEEGRRRLARTRGLTLLRRALLRRDKVLFDLAMDLLIPPLSKLVTATGAGLAAAGILAIWAGQQARVSLLAWGTPAVCVGIYTLRGWQLSGTGGRGLLDLLAAPFYMMWKLSLGLTRSARGKDEWVRTSREGRTP